jgi:phosphate-selective porin OprO and OprP
LARDVKRAIARAFAQQPSGTVMSLKHCLLRGAAACALAVACGAARAQTPPSGAALQQIQQQIQQLQQQLQSLQSQVSAQAQAQAQAAAPAPQPSASAPHATQSSGNRFGLESADGQYSIALTGRLQFDLGGYPDYHQDSHATTPSDLNAGFNARRARLGVVGKFAGDWNYAFIYDFGGSSDGFDVTNPSGGSGLGVSGGALSGIENAYVTYNGINKPTYAVPLAFDFGYLDAPFTLDEATSSNDIMFMERSSSQVVATEFGSGDSRSAFGVRSNDARYWAGVYATGPASGAAHNVGEPLAMFGRFTYQPLQAPDYSLHVGVDLEGLLKPADVTATAAGAAVGTISSSLQTLALSDRPELRIDPTSLLSTGAIGSAANPVTGGSVFGVETAAATATCSSRARASITGSRAPACRPTRSGAAMPRAVGPSPGSTAPTFRRPAPIPPSTRRGPSPSPTEPGAPSSWRPVSAISTSTTISPPITPPRNRPITASKAGGRPSTRWD